MTRGGKREGTGRRPDFPGEETRGASFNLPTTLLAALKVRAEAEGTTQARVLAKALAEYLERHASPPS